MSNLLPNELLHARELMYQAKFGEALEIIENFEKNKSITPEDQLSALIIKGKIFAYLAQYKEAGGIGEQAYQISQKLGNVLRSIDALLLKSIFEDGDKALELTLEAETLLNSLGGKSSSDLSEQKADILHRKTWIYFNKTDYDKALEAALGCLVLRENLGNKLDLTRAYLVLGWINVNQGNHSKALEYAKKSMECNKELNYIFAITDGNFLIAYIYYLEGDYDKALQYCNHGLSIKEISVHVKLNILNIAGWVHFLKNELNQALKIHQQALDLAEESNNTYHLITNLNNLGYINRMIGKTNLAVDYLERSISLPEEEEFPYEMARSFAIIILKYLDENSREKADQYFSRLVDLYYQTKDKGDVDLSFFYVAANAFMLKTSTRMRDRVEAQALFKEVIERKLTTNVMDLFLILSNYCDLLLEELSMYNDPEILDEINALITKSIYIAEKSNNYSFLAETKLLKAKLALIQMNIEEARSLMAEAQRIAELHGLNLLAWGISSELDKLLDQGDVWNTFKKEEAPIAERIKFASTGGVLERLQGKSALEPPEAVDEQPTVLLILAEGGVLIFSYPFTNEWKIDEDLFSSFLSGFTTLSTEFFSKGLDRAKFGDEMILMESIGSFSCCYLFKGQTYLAKQKLIKFIEEVQKDKVLWKNLEQHFNTSQVLEVNENPPLKNLINKIFVK